MKPMLVAIDDEDRDSGFFDYEGANTIISDGFEWAAPSVAILGRAIDRITKGQNRLFGRELALDYFCKQGGVFSIRPGGPWKDEDSHPESTIAVAIGAAEVMRENLHNPDAEPTFDIRPTIVLNNALFGSVPHNAGYNIAYGLARFLNVPHEHYPAFTAQEFMGVTAEVPTDYAMHSANQLFKMAVNIDQIQAVACAQQRSDVLHFTQARLSGYKNHAEAELPIEVFADSFALMLSGDMPEFKGNDKSYEQIFPIFAPLKLAYLQGPVAYDLSQRNMPYPMQRQKEHYAQFVERIHDNTGELGTDNVSRLNSFFIRHSGRTRMIDRVELDWAAKTVLSAIENLSAGMQKTSTAIMR